MVSSRNIGTSIAVSVLAASLAEVGCSPDIEDALLIGHRGSPSTAPENSFAGFQDAFRFGADGVEFDVQFSSDGRNVVMHDNDLDRTTTCTGAVSDRTLEELRSCQLSNGESVVPLDEALEFMLDKFQILFLEIKVPEQTPSEDRILAQADEAIERVLESGYPEKIVIISYDDVVLQRVARRRRGGILGGWDDYEGDSIGDATRYNLRWVLMSTSSVEPWMNDVVPGLNKKLAVYHLNTPSELASALDAGASAVMADDVRAMAAMLGREPSNQ
jgi:glycerophosphoryl diester phosphodiesterase